LTINIQQQIYSSSTSSWGFLEDFGELRIDNPTNEVSFAFLLARLDPRLTVWRSVEAVLKVSNTVADLDTRLVVDIEGAPNASTIQLQGFYPWSGNSIYADASRFY
jgi:hypothetical protein